MSNYSWNAADYEKHSKAQQKWARELIDKLNLKGSETILDLGCGDGKVTAEIAGDTIMGSVIGVDSSRAMVDLARERYPETAYPNLSFEQMDAREITFSERFDVVFSNAALHWVKDHKPVVAGLAKCLRPGGRLSLQMGGKGNAENILSVLAEMLESPEWGQYFVDFEFPYGFYGTDEYEALLQQNDFKINRLELISKDMEHEGKGGLAGWIRTTWLPYTERVPLEKRDAFVDAICTQYLDGMPVDASGKVHVAMVRLEVAAEKAA